MGYSLINFSSVEQLPDIEVRALFTVNFRVTDNLAYLAEGTPALCRPSYTTQSITV